MVRLAQGIPGFDLDIPLTLQVREKLVHQAPGYLYIVGHLLGGDGIPEEGMLEQKLDQQTFGQAQVFKSLGHGGIGVDKRGQDLRFHQVEIQEMLGQVTAGFFLPEQGRSQLFGFQDSGFNYALRQVHVRLTLMNFTIIGFPRLNWTRITGSRRDEAQERKGRVGRRGNGLHLRSKPVRPRPI